MSGSMLVNGNLSGGISNLNIFTTTSRVATTLTGNQTAIDVTGVNYLICNNATLLNIQGLAGGIDGQELLIRSVGTGNVTIEDQSASAPEANKFLNMVVSGPTILMSNKGTARYVYSTASSRWRLVDHQMGGWLTATFNAAEFTGNGAMTWTVAAGDVALDQFTIIDRTMFWNFKYLTTTIGGTLNTTLQKLLPNGYQAAVSTSQFSNGGIDNGTSVVLTIALIFPTQISILKLPSANWASSTDNTNINGALQLHLL